MSSEMGVFALRQLVSSMIIVGPILLIIGVFNFVFTQNRKIVLAYVLVGILLTGVGAYSLYQEFGKHRASDELVNSNSEK